MVITDYRVQSVLRTYGRQLQRSKLSAGLGSSDRQGQSERITISDEAKRRLIMERMTSQVLEKAYPRQDGSGEGEGDPE